jgi:hypothetical protein
MDWNGNTDGLTVRSISTTSISTGTITTRAISGDGAGLSNLHFDNFATGTTIPRERYGAYTIPWAAMEDTGSIQVDSVNFQF